MGSKKYKNKTCVYCAMEQASSTGDHIFAREFFLENKRGSLPQVPACKACNNKKSGLEHYLTSVLPFGGQHSDSMENLSSMVPKRLRKNKALHEKLCSGMRRDWFETESGIIAKTTSIPIDFDKIEMLIDYIVRGLCWENMHVQLLKKDMLKVKAATKAEDEFFRNNIFNLKVKYRVEKNLGDGTVSYEGIQDIDDPKLTVWRIKLYGGIQLGGDENDKDARTSIFVVYTADSEKLRI